MSKQTNPLDFLARLRWIDGSPLANHIEPYRARIFEQALFTFEGNRPRYNLALCGRAKKNWKTADLILAALYRLVLWRSETGNQCYILANDGDQAGDDLELAKKIVRANGWLGDDLEIKQRMIERKDGQGFLEILPANDVIGSHGKTYLFAGFDEIHGYKTWDIFEALALDPHRTDAMQWVTSYASIYHKPGVPLFDLFNSGKHGRDSRMFFSWYAADYCTDPACETLAPEARANPSMSSWPDQGYLAQQQSRLPSHKYRRLHLNLPGSPDGSALSAENIMGSVDRGVKSRAPEIGLSYAAFVDLSGGSSDDATLAICHRDNDGRAVLDCIINQGQRPPFDPAKAVQRFAAKLREYGVCRVTGDRYAGETFRSAFLNEGITYQPSELSASDIYEAFEPPLNGGRIVLLDEPTMESEFLGLVWKGNKITHPSGEHDDWSNAAAGAVWAALNNKGVSGFDVSKFIRREKSA